MAFFVSAIVWICGCLITGLVPILSIFMLGRVIKGIGIGFICSSVPVYVTEIFPLTKKGSSISLFHLYSTIGAVTIYFVTFILQRNYPDKFAFQIACLVQAFPALILMALALVLPESPKWLASKSKWAKAAKSLERVKTINMSAKLDKTYKQIVTNAYTEGRVLDYSSYADLFGIHWRKTSAGLVVQFFCQIAGVIPLLNLFSFVCDLCGLEGGIKTLVISCSYVVFGLFTIMPLLLLDRSRRIDIMAYGLFCTSIIYIALWIVSIFHAVHNSSVPLGWILQEAPASTVLALCLFLFCVYSSTLSSVSWLYVVEIFPDEGRAKGTASCMCVSHIITTTLTLIYPVILPRLKYWLFMMLGIISLVGSMCLLYLPETKYNNDAQCFGHPVEDLPVKETLQGRQSEESDPISEETKVEHATKNDSPTYEYTDPSLIKISSLSSGSVVRTQQVPKTTIDEVLEIYGPTSELSAKTHLNLFASEEWSEDNQDVDSLTRELSPVTGFTHYQTVSAATPEISLSADLSGSSLSNARMPAFYRSDSTELQPNFHFKKSKNMLHG